MSPVYTTPEEQRIAAVLARLAPEIEAKIVERLAPLMITEAVP